MGKGATILILFLLLFSLDSFPEGTKQIIPVAGRKGKLCIDKSRNDFGFFNAPPEFRINIYIADLSERFYFGLGKATRQDSLSQVEVQYQLRDPDGNIIIGPMPVPTSGAGFIPTYEQACAGPLPATGGYDPVAVGPATTGNYSLEFYYPPDQGSTYTYVSYITFDFFDITVTTGTGIPVNGRTWSKAWQFHCGLVEPPKTDHRFYGTMFILSDDSIVTSINCNGFIGGTFSVSSNQTGCSTTGNISVDRQSRSGFHTYPQYKVFLSDPDSLIFPTGKAKPGIILPVEVTNTCTTGTVDLGIRVTQDGLVEILIEVDPAPGANPRDVTITANVTTNPGGSGYNILRWNGNDGLGNLVPSGTAIKATIKFIHGITHLPIYDIEYNDNGYVVEVVRPAGPKPDIYWDDSLLGDGSNVNLNGCNDIQGCHFWDNATGDTNTINSWWYVASSAAIEISFPMKRVPGSPGSIHGDASFCEGGIVRTYSIRKMPGTTTYTWSYSGTGAIITGNDTTATVDFTPTATSGLLSVWGTNMECGDGPASAVPINFHPPPLVSLADYDPICFNEPEFILSGGSPPGGEYLIAGIPEAGFDPSVAGAGSHPVIYHYTDNHGCENSDSSAILVKTGRECEIVIWMPNAFTPNGDGLNDIFRPVYQNIRYFSLNIYNRAGALLFSGSDPASGWDGTFRGSLCPVGTYVYKVVYESSHAPPENTTITGEIILVR